MRSNLILNLSDYKNLHTSLPDDNSSLVPPDPISNSEVKRTSADGSAGLPCVRVGHRQAFLFKSSQEIGSFFCFRLDLLLKVQII